MCGVCAAHGCFLLHSEWCPQLVSADLGDHCDGCGDCSCCAAAAASDVSTIYTPAGSHSGGAGTQSGGAFGGAGVGRNGPVASYLFDGINGKANDASGVNHGTVAGGLTSVADRNGVPNGAYMFDGASATITLDIPFPAADSDFSVAIWLKPTAMNDGTWHAFLGYQAGDTRSPTLMVNNGLCDVGFCDCQGNQGGFNCPGNQCSPKPWEPGFHQLQTAGGFLPVGQCDPDPDQPHKCRTASCCDCATANTMNAGDGVAGNGLHWDTHTAQTYNGNQHNGQRFAGVVDSYFTPNQYVHIVWTKAGQSCKFYRNGALTDTVVCPTHVDLHDLYEIGRECRRFLVFASAVFFP